MITGRQMRAARALLEWTVEDLARNAGLNRATVFNIEKGKDTDGGLGAYPYTRFGIRYSHRGFC